MKGHLLYRGTLSGTGCPWRTDFTVARLSIRFLRGVLQVSSRPHILLAPAGDNKICDERILTKFPYSTCVVSMHIHFNVKGKLVHKYCNLYIPIDIISTFVLLYSDHGRQNTYFTDHRHDQGIYPKTSYLSICSYFQKDARERWTFVWVSSV